MASPGIEHAHLECYYSLQPRRDHTREPQLEAVCIRKHLGQVAREVKIGLFGLLIKELSRREGGAVGCCPSVSTVRSYLRLNPWEVVPTCCTSNQINREVK